MRAAPDARQPVTKGCKHLAGERSVVFQSRGNIADEQAPAGFPKLMSK
jgi:hypothetical protein